MAPSRKSVNQATVDSVILKKIAKAIEVAESTNHQPTLSDIHISDAEDSHPTAVLPLKRQTSEPKPPLNSDQLLQMLSFVQKQMENQ